RDTKIGAAGKVNATDGLDRQWDHAACLALHQPFEAVTDAHDADVADDGPNGRGADDAIDARCRPAPAQDRHPLRIRHGTSYAHGPAQRDVRALKMRWTSSIER